MQIKTILKYHPTPSRMAIISKWQQKQVGEDIEKLETLYTADGNVNGAAILENSLAVPENVKQRIAIRPSNSTARYKPKRNKNTYLHKNLPMNVHSRVVHNRQKNGSNPDL